MSKTNKLKIQILVDNPDSWILPYTKKLQYILNQLGHKVDFVNHPDNIQEGDILFLLGCTKIFKDLHLNTHNLVVHESDLPSGKGWSPLTWQILEGKKRIPITLFEAIEDIDAGPIYISDNIKLEGHELIDEIREKQGKKTIELCVRFIEKYPFLKAKPQNGESSYYKKRVPQDSKLDIEKSIKEQFNLLRVVDNERYPAFFNYKGKKYILKVYKYE